MGQLIGRQIFGQIKEDLLFFPVVGIIGPRQVGKTTIVKQVQAVLNGEVLYLDLELDSDQAKLAEAESFLKFHQSKCVVIDKIQRMPSLFPLIRALVDLDRRPARFVLLGSASPDIIKGGSETLAGRISYIELTPFSRTEISETFPLHTHWFNGGFPNALLAGKEGQASRWLKAFVDTYLHRDLLELGHQFSIPVFRSLLSMLSVVNGNVLNVSDLSRSLGVSQPTVNRYLDLLEGSFIINRLQPYFVNVTKRLVKAPKVYIRDSGILHSIAKISSYEQLLGHPLVGASWEGYVIEQIRRVTGNEWEYYYYRTHKGAETDLVLITPSGRKICIEIKFSASPAISRGFYETVNDIQPDFQFIVVPSGESYPRGNGLWVCNLDEFLDKLMQGDLQ